MNFLLTPAAKIVGGVLGGLVLTRLAWKAQGPIDAAIIKHEKRKLDKTSS